MQQNPHGILKALEKIGIRQVPLADALVLLMRSEFRDINSELKTTGPDKWVQAL